MRRLDVTSDERGGASATTVGKAMAIMQEASFDHHKAKNSGDRGDHHRVKPPGPTTAGAGAVATRSYAGFVIVVIIATRPARSAQDLHPNQMSMSWQSRGESSRLLLLPCP